MKTSRLIFSCGLFWLAVHTAQAQSADDFFNGGAQFYVSNNIADALTKVEAGRKVYPDDAKLKKLEELLKQQQQQNQQNKQNQSQKSQSSKNSQSQQQNQSQKQQNAQKQQQNPQSQQKQNNAQKEKSSPQNRQPEPMTPQEAKRMLDSQKGNEQILPYKPQNQPENQNSPIKDW